MDKEEFIFQSYKDNVIYYTPFKKEMIKKFRLSENQIKKIHRKLLEYQKDKYGDVLSNETAYDYLTEHSKEECKRRSILARARKNCKRRYWEGK